MPGRLSQVILLFAAAAITICVAKSDVAEDEPLKQLFESFLPNNFLEKPVASEESIKSKSHDANVEELMKTAKSMASGLQNVFNGLNSPDNGDCVFTCPNDVKPTAAPGFKPVPNGCGTHGLKLDVSDMPGITECCDSHDICYGTCNSGQRACDRQFNACMADACEKLRSSGVITTEKRFTECMAVGATFHLTAMALGCEFYRDAQRAACTCGGDTPAQEKIRRYNNEVRAKQSAEPATEDALDQIDLSNPMFDLPDVVDRDEL